MAPTSRRRPCTSVLIWQYPTFPSSNGWINRFERRHSIAHTSLSGENRRVDSETAEDWKNYELLQEIEGYDLCDNIMLMRLVHFSVYN
jgi:hypothetical protein